MFPREVPFSFQKDKNKEKNKEKDKEKTIAITNKFQTQKPAYTVKLERPEGLPLLGSANIGSEKSQRYY